MFSFDEVHMIIKLHKPAVPFCGLLGQVNRKYRGGLSDIGVISTVMSSYFLQHGRQIWIICHKTA